MQITLNGAPREIPAESTVEGLLQQLQAGPRGVAVEINRELVPRTEYAARSIEAGDQIEIVTLAGGGA